MFKEHHMPPLPSSSLPTLIHNTSTRPPPAPSSITGWFWPRGPGGVGVGCKQTGGVGVAGSCCTAPFTSWSARGGGTGRPHSDQQLTKDYPYTNFMLWVISYGSIGSTTLVIFTYPWCDLIPWRIFYHCVFGKYSHKSWYLWKMWYIKRIWEYCGVISKSWK